MAEKKFYDTYVRSTSQKDMDFIESLGYDGIVLVCENVKNQKHFKSQLNQLKTGLEVLTAAVVGKDPDNQARKLINSHDLIYVRSNNVDDYKKASESWVVDAFVSNELSPKYDMVNQRDTGLDVAAIKFMKERNIRHISLLDDLLSNYGWRLAQLVARLVQNIRLFEKYDVDYTIASGAKDKYGFRTPKDLSAITYFLKKTISEKPLLEAQHLIQKAFDRNNDDIILSGLEVIDWAGQKPNPQKRKFGWY